MPQPSAPMLQAEYHNYNEHASFNDYYGGYEPKPANGTWSASNGPRRVEVTTKENSGCCATAGIHCLSALYFLRSFLILVSLLFFFYNGYKSDATLSWAGFEGLNVLACILMFSGIESRNPFFCVLFTVLRTLETFLSLIFVLVFGWAVVDPRSEVAKFIAGVVKQAAAENVRHITVNWGDFSYTLSMFLCLASLLIFAICMFSMRLSWTSTMWAADERKRLQLNSNRHEVSRVMVASDELYTNY